MLPKQKMDAIAVMIGVEADVFAKAISDEQEVNIELPEGRFLTQEKESLLLDNHGKKKYDEGKSKTLKDVFEGKTKEDYLSEYKSSVLEEAKLEPNKKLEEKETAISNLQKALQDKEQEVTDFKTQLENNVRRSKALTALPSLREDIGIKKEEALDIIMRDVETKEGTIYKNGVPQLDSYQSPIALNDFLKEEVQTRGWTVKKIQGNGGKQGVQIGETPKTYAEFQKYCESKKWNEGSYEAKQYLKTVKDKNPDFDMDN